MMDLIHPVGGDTNSWYSDGIRFEQLKRIILLAWMVPRKKENIHKMDAVTPADTPTDTPADTRSLPPCRQAELFITACCLCGRKMCLKSFRYSHRCGKSFHPMQRALEQQVAAEKAINTRMASIEPLERRVQHTAAHTQQNVEKQNKYASLLNF